MPTQRIPLVGSITNRVTTTTYEGKDQEFINCFPIVVKNAITGQPRVDLVKRYGFLAGATIASYQTQLGICLWSSKSDGSVPTAYSIGGKTFNVVKVYRVSNSSGVTQVGGDIALSENCYSLSETSISDVSTLVALIKGSVTNCMAFYYPEGGAWTQILSNYPGNLGTPVSVVGDAVHHDGYMFVMGVNGNIYNSDLNSVTTWTVTSFIKAQRSPDLGIGLALYMDMVVAFSARSIEFFKNTGNATGSPLTRIPNSLNIGALPYNNVTSSGMPSRTILPVNSTIYFIGVDGSTGIRHVYRLNGLGAERVSTAAIDLVINTTTAFFTPNLSGVISMFGYSHVIMSTEQSITSTVPDYAYCIETGVWWRFYSSVNSHAASCLGDRMFGGATPYSISGPTAYLDGTSTVIPMTVQTQPIDHGTNRKKSFTAAELVCDSQTTSGDISISWSDDDYANFSTPRTIDPSTGQKRITRLGATQRRYNNKRAWKITEAVNRPFRGEALDIEYTVGST